MAQWRGVFIAPSTINHRAHQRSKSHPDISPSSQPRYKSEHSHYPRSGSFGVLCSKPAPSIPSLSKVLTLEFRQTKSKIVKKTSRYAILCNPILNPIGKDQIEKASRSRCSWKVRNTFDTDEPREKRLSKKDQYFARTYNKEPVGIEEDVTDGPCSGLAGTRSSWHPKTNQTKLYKGNSIQEISTSVDQDCDRNLLHSFQKKKERGKPRVKVKVKESEIPGKERLNFGNILHPEVFERVPISEETCALENRNEGKQLEEKKEHINKPEGNHFSGRENRKQIRKAKKISDLSKSLERGHSSLKGKECTKTIRFLEEFEEHIESTKEKALDQSLGNTDKDNLGLELQNNYYLLEAQIQKKEELRLDVNDNQTRINKTTNSRTNANESNGRKLGSETENAFENKKVGSKIFSSKSKNQEFESPGNVRKLETQNTIQNKEGEHKFILAAARNYIKSPIPVQEKTFYCSSKQELFENSKSEVENPKQEGLKRQLYTGNKEEGLDLFEKAGKGESFKEDVLAKNPKTEIILQLNSEEMASGQSVKANKELWENRETVGKLEENLVDEQRISESKEKEIQNLKKEMKMLEKDLNERKNESESLDEAKSKLSSIETENRILVNQVKMVEEANKNLYKELYEAKTKLRFLEGKCENATVQNTEMNRRLSHILQSSLDKCTGFTGFLHQLDIDMISTESALRKFKAQRQALEDVLKEDHKKPKSSLKFPFAQEEKQSLFDSKVKELLRSQLEKSLDLQFEDVSSKQIHCDERIADLENIMKECLNKQIKTEEEKFADQQKKINLAGAHVKALKEIENKLVNLKKKTEELISSKKDSITKEAREISNKLSAIQHGKRTRNRSARKNLFPESSRKNSVEEIADIDRTIRTMKSKSEEKHDDLSENEKEILSLNEKMSKALEDKLHLTEELQELQTNIQALESRYDEKRQETESLENELSSKRQEILEMATNMEQALKEIALEQQQPEKDSVSVGDVTGSVGERSNDSQPNNNNGPYQNSDKEEIKMIKEELAQTILLLKNEQAERQEALKMNDDLFLELKNREQEISKLVLELEHLKEKGKQDFLQERPGKISELWSSIHETNKTKEETDQLQKELEQELIFKDKEFEKLEKTLGKLGEESEKQEMLLKYYKDELMKLQQEKQDKLNKQGNSLDMKTGEKIRHVLIDKNEELDEHHKEVAKLETKVCTRNDDIQKLEQDVADLQEHLKKEIEISMDYKRKASYLEEVVHKEVQAKEHANKRNKELEDELQAKNVKLNNLSSFIESKKVSECKGNGKDSTPDYNTTISELRATMQQIQDEKEKQATEVDNLVTALEEDDEKSGVAQPGKLESRNSAIIEQKQLSKVDTEEGLEGNRVPVEDQIREQRVNEVLAERHDWLEEPPLDEDYPAAHRKEDEQMIGDADKKSDKTEEKALKEKANDTKNGTAFSQSLDEKDDKIKKLQGTIERLEQELQQSRSENILLENEAADIMDDGCLKNENRELRNQVNELSIRLSIARADEHDLQDELNIVENRTKSLEESVERLETLDQELRSANDELCSEKELFVQELELMKKKVEILEDEIKLLKDETMKIDVVDNRTFLEENETFKTEIYKITLQLDVNKENLERLQGELESSENKVNELEVKLSKLQKEKNGLEILVDDLSFQSKFQEKEMTLLKKKIVVYEDEIKLVEQELARKSEELKGREEDFQKLLEDNSSKELERQELENELKEKEETSIAEEHRYKQLVEKNLDLRSQINKLKMDSTESRHEQRRLERDFNELRDRLREADRKFSSTKDDKIRTEDELGTAKKRIGQLEKELNDTRFEIKVKNDTIRKLNLKNSELQAALSEREEEQRREERLRMENMKSLDALKIKMGKMDNDDKKQRERLFSLKSACSEANEAYEIVKKQNMNLRNDMQELKKKLATRDLDVDNNKREKKKLEEQILNASRTIDDICKYSARDDSLSPDSALGISISSLTELGSGPNSPNSDISDSLFVPGDEEMKFSSCDQQGLLYKMPTMIENFRAVMRENDVMKSKLVEMLNSKEKKNSQIHYYSSLSDDLQKDLGEKEKFVNELQNKGKILKEELEESKLHFDKIERDFVAVATEADEAKTTLQVREETVAELGEKVEMLEEKESALELYSKSIAEKYENEATQKQEFEDRNLHLTDKTKEQQLLLEKLEKKLSEYSTKPKRVSEPEIKVIAASQLAEERESDVAMATLEGKLDNIVNYSEALENSLTDVKMGYHRLQSENERLKKEMVRKEDFQNLETKLQEREESFKGQEEVKEQHISDLERQREALHNDRKENKDAIIGLVNREKELMREFKALRETFSPLQQANDILKAEVEALKESLKQNEENRVKFETELKSTKTKMCEMEITNRAYKEENDRLRNDVITLSEEKCEVECKVSEAERREKKLNEVIDKERAQQDELRAEHESALSMCDTLQTDLSKAKDNINSMEAEQDKTQKAKNEMETKLMDIASQNSSLGDELGVLRKDLRELEERYKKALDAEEILNQKINKSSLENARLATAYDQSQKRRNNAERGILEANAKNEDFDAELERVRTEKASLLKEIAQKEETIENMEAKKSELEQEVQKLTNELYHSTRKVLSLQLNLESLRNEVSQMGKDLRRLVLGAIGREARDEAEEKSMEADLEMNLFENEVVVQALRQAIKATERSLDQIRPEAIVSDLENKNCEKDIDCVHREFAYLKDQLSSFKNFCQKLSDETKRIKEDVKLREALLQDVRQQYDSLKEENAENKERIVRLQARCTDFEALSAEYEENTETTHNELVHANQHIAGLEGTITKLEQKKNVLEKDRLVFQEKVNNLEANQRASKDESRNNKKRIASLEVESNEKQGMAHELERIEGNLAELRLKYDDVVKDREEVKTELAMVKEEMRQQGLELKNSKKDTENFKKHIMIEREMRMRVEQDLNEHVEELKTAKKSLNALHRTHTKLEEEKEILEEKAKLLEEAGQTLKKELEVQAIETKRLRDYLTDTRNELQNTTLRGDGSEREKKKLIEELVHADEQVKKLQGTCNELLNEKGSATDKVMSLNETLESMIRSHDETIDHLKQDLMNANKDLSVTKSALERSQKRHEELQNAIKKQEVKIKSVEDKKQELFEKFWDSQNKLAEAESCIDNLDTEIKELKGKVANNVAKIEQIEGISQQEREENEKLVEDSNEKISTLKTQNQRLLLERDNLKSTLEETEDSLHRASEELQQTTSTLTEKEKNSFYEIEKLENAVDDLRKVSEDQRVELRRTKEALKDASRENKDLKEKFNTTEEKLVILESKVDEQDNDNVDALAEAQAKLNVVSKMKASNSGERFAEMQSSTILSEDDADFDELDGVQGAGLRASIKDVVGAFHQACMSSFSDNRTLQESLAQANDENARLEEALKKDRNNMAEMKRYLHETEKKKTKLEEEVKRLRLRLESLKHRTIEMERNKDNELCDLKGEKMILDKEHWRLKEEFEELRSQSKETEEERDGYAEDLNNTRVQVIEARNDIKKAQEHLDTMQEKQLGMKKKTFVLEAREKSLQQQVQESERELYASNAKTEELEKLYENANQKKTELFSQASKAEDKIISLENQLQENKEQQKELEEENSSLGSEVSELERTLEETTYDLKDTKERNEELEIQRGSLLASNEILKHQAEVSRSEYNILKDSYDKVHEETVNISTILNQKTIEKDNLNTEFKCLAQEKERLQDALSTSESQLRESEDNLVIAFQETEQLKRQMLKVQSISCAESAKHQAEGGKRKSELESTKKELAEKEDDYTEKAAKLKAIEKDNEALKKELNDLRLRESEIKLDYTSANSKLQSYVLERECWEREVKTVLNEIEQQKSDNAAKEHRLDRLRMRYEQEIGFLSQRVAALERELKIVQEAAEQRRYADDIAHRLSLEAKDMEIDNFKMRLQSTRIHASDRNTVVDEMKNQLDERTVQINELMEQMRILKDSYHLELASVQAELKCVQMENLLKLRKDMGNDNQIASSQESVGDLLEAIKSSRKESERLRQLLGNKMKEMKNLKKHLISERYPRGNPASRPAYAAYSRDNEGHLNLV